MDKSYDYDYETEYDYTWDDQYYGTGPTEPPKERRGVTALMLIVVIFLFGIITVLSILNIRLFQELKVKKQETEISISLPTAKSATVPGRMPGEIILNLAKDGTVSVNGQTLTLAEVTERLTRIAKLYPGQPVVIRADKETAYESLVGVIDACRTADVWNFSLATKDEEDK